MTALQEPKSGRKIAVAILVTLVLGAIGSGIWDRIGGPIFDLVTRLLIDGLDLINRTYKDSIYEEAAHGFQETSSSFIHQQFLGVLSIAYICLILRHPWLKDKMPKNRKSKFKNFLRSSKGFYLMSFITVLVFTACLVSVARLTYVREVIVYAQTSMERIAPHIDEQAEEELLARFRSVRNAEDYYAFYEDLQSCFEKFKIEEHGSRPL